MPVHAVSDGAGQARLPVLRNIETAANRKAGPFAQGRAHHRTLGITGKGRRTDAPTAADSCLERESFWHRWRGGDTIHLPFPARRVLTEIDRMTRKIASVRPLCRSALPSWIVFPVLAGLVLVSGLIVALGWLIAAPAPRAAQTDSAFLPSPPVLTGRGTGGEGVGAADGDLPPPIAPPAPEASEPPLEPARELPMFGETVPPTLRTAPMPIETPPAVTLAPKLELKWVIEKLPANPRGETSHLIMPIEIAKLPAAPIPYSVRRLSLPGEAPKPPKLP